MTGLRNSRKNRWLLASFLCALLLFMEGCAAFKIVRVPIPIPTFGLGSGAEKKSAKKPQELAPGETAESGPLVGEASYYGREFHKRTTASGETYNMYAMTAAHPTLPFGTQVRVTNLENRRSVVVRINDRGPFKNGRIIDVSYGVATKLDFVAQGLAQVKLEIL
ncbi:MAG: septal ring lytic transglycosylase RlpA family protein [Candidatus Omnitrophota bacterium]